MVCTGNIDVGLGVCVDIVVGRIVIIVDVVLVVVGFEGMLLLQSDPEQQAAPMWSSKEALRLPNGAGKTCISWLHACM